MDTSKPAGERRRRDDRRQGGERRPYNRDGQRPAGDRRQGGYGQRPAGQGFNRGPRPAAKEGGND